MCCKRLTTSVYEVPASFSGSVARPRITVLLATMVACVAVTNSADAGAIDLSSWSVVQYNFHDQPPANWVLSNGNTVATQTVNADGSILLSNFDALNTVIDGKWRVNTSNDDDFMGFVFGYHGRGEYYLFDWKQADQNDAIVGFAERGMSVKLVDIPGNADPVEQDIWQTSGTAGRVTPLFHNTTPWQDFETYDFHLLFTPGTFSIKVTDDGTSAVLLDLTLHDSTFTSGNFGFYNDSQDSVQYQGFTVDPAPSAVPEPSSLCILVAGLGCVGGMAWRQRRRAA